MRLRHVLVFISLLSVMTTTFSTEKEQILKEYTNALRLLSDEDSEMKISSQTRISELEIEVGVQHQVNDDPLTSDFALEKIKQNIQLYIDLLDNNPGKKGNDKLLYQLANAYEEIVDLDQAIATLNQLINLYPNSEYTEEAVFRRAELLFAQIEFEKADIAYRNAIAFGKETPFYTFALYKHGWTLFKQERYEGSINSFLSVLDYLTKDIPTHNDVLLLSQLKDEDAALFFDTLRAISLSFSYIHDGLSITDRLALHSERRNEYLIYGNLGELYVKKERYFEAAEVYSDFATKHPAHIQSPDFFIRSIETAKVGKFSKLVLEKKQEFAKRYALNGEFWEKHTANNAPKVISYLKVTLKELANHYHALAQLSKKTEDFQQAIHWYKQYIAAFNNDPTSAEINFTLAEVLYQNKEYGEAANQFEKVAYDYAEYEKSADAGYAALLAYQKQSTVEKGAPPSPLWLEKAQHFASSYPDHPESTNVLLKVAEGLYATQSWNELIAAEEELLNRRSINKKQRQLAMTMIGHAKSKLALFEEAADAYFQAIKLTHSSAQKKALAEWAAVALYKQGEQQKNNEHFAEAAALFQRIRKEVPGTPIQAVADYDAAAVWFKLGEWERSIKLLTAMQKEFPEHPLLNDVPALLASSYEKLNKPERAAEQFIKVSQLAENSTIQKEALWRAAELYEENGQIEQSFLLYKKYLQRFPEALDDGIVIRYKLAMRDKALKKEGYKSQLTEIVQRYKQSAAQYSERSRPFVAKAALVLAEDGYIQYQNMLIIEPLNASLKKKSAAMQSLLSTYETIVAYGDADMGTEATYRIGEIMHNFYTEIIRSERPKDLQGEELKQYIALLKEQALPYKQQAIKTHEINVQRIKEGLYNDAIQASLVALGKLSPIRYGKKEMYPKYIEIKDLPKNSAVDLKNAQKIMAEMQKGLDDKAYKLLKALLKKYPKHDVLNANMGVIAFNRSESILASKLFKKAIKYNDKLPDSYLFLGLIARQAGQFSVAEQYYLEALKRAKNDTYIHLNLGILYDLYLFKPSEAKQQYETLNEKEVPSVQLWIKNIEGRLEASDKNV